MSRITPRLVIAGISGSSGKTLISLGLTRVLSRKGFRVCPFKKGPDYIDSAWLSYASHSPAFCLDPYFLTMEQLRSHFIQCSSQSDFAIIEGNRGIFDGMDVNGTCSTAQLAKTLNSPVILVLNAAKMTRTAAALVEGIRNFDKNLHLAGVILNNTGSSRHADSLREAIEKYSEIPILGIIPRFKENPIPERHLGLSLTEKGNREEILDRLADMIEANTNIEMILQFFRNAKPIEGSIPSNTVHQESRLKPSIGFIKDDAIWFYYEENLRSLKAAGANLVPISVLDKEPWPKLDGLYIGGGFPELFAEQLAHSQHLSEIKLLSEQGVPIYAECGGFILLAHSLRFGDEKRNMANIFPTEIVFHKSPQALGYTQIKTIGENPFHPVGSSWKAHEFHYSACFFDKNTSPQGVLLMQRGRGMFSAEGDCLDGLLIRNTFGCWNHLFAPAVPHWAPRFVDACVKK